MTLKVLSVLCLCFGLSFSVSLPSYFNKCSRSDPNLNDCITNSGNLGIPQLIYGDKKIHIMNLVPLFVPQMFIDVNGGLKMNFTNCNIHGLENIRLDESQWDLENRHVVSKVSLDYTHLIGDYDISGRILVLPINGQGPCNITFTRPTFRFAYDFELEDRKGQNYLKILNPALTYETERAYFRLENLFDGNQQLAETMNTFLNENWKEVNDEIGARVGDALALVFANILQQMFYRIPYDELFDP